MMFNFNGNHNEIRQFLFNEIQILSLITYITIILAQEGKYVLRVAGIL